MSDQLFAALVMAHPDGCTCRRCARLVHLTEDVAEPVEEIECEDRRRRQHRLHHHHIADDDELERAETELAWEEIGP